MGAVLYLLANALIDPSSRWQTVGVLGACLLGVPLYYLTVGRKAPGGPRGGM